MNGSVEVGSYVLRVGAEGGTLIERGTGVAADSAASLERVLATEGPKEVSATERAAGAVEDASAVTAQVERAVALAKGVAAGDALKPEQLALEVGAMLDLLERLDREGRHKEALRMARALVDLLMLLRRWAELLRTLRMALRAGEALDDLDAIGWAEHELGTLHLAGGDVEGAERHLRRAREVRERIGDRCGLAATNRNLGVLCERLREMLRNEDLVRAGGKRPAALRVLSLGVLFALLFGVGLAVGLVSSDSKGSSGTANVAGGGGVTTASGSGGGGTGTTGSGGGPYPLRVVIEGGGSVEGGGIQCPGGPCEMELPAGEEVSLVAIGNEKFPFEGFGGDCEGDSCSLTMDGPKTVLATFGTYVAAEQPAEPVEEEEAEEETEAAPVESEAGE
jgi:hypothetical protein